MEGNVFKIDTFKAQPNVNVSGDWVITLDWRNLELHWVVYVKGINHIMEGIEMRVSEIIKWCNNDFLVIGSWIQCFWKSGNLENIHQWINMFHLRKMTPLQDYEEEFMRKYPYLHNKTADIVERYNEMIQRILDFQITKKGEYAELFNERNWKWNSVDLF